MAAAYAPIAYKDISQWAHDHGEADTTENLDEFVFLVQQMDDEWLKLNQIKPKTGR